MVQSKNAIEGAYICSWLFYILHTCIIVIQKTQTKNEVLIIYQKSVAKSWLYIKNQETYLPKFSQET